MTALPQEKEYFSDSSFISRLTKTIRSQLASSSWLPPELNSLNLSRVRLGESHIGYVYLAVAR